MSDIKIDATARRQLLEAMDCADAAAEGSCGFFACPGPEKPFVPCATCNVCRAAQVLRRAMLRMGLLPADDCRCCRLNPMSHGSWTCHICGHEEAGP